MNRRAYQNTDKKNFFGKYTKFGTAGLICLVIIGWLFCDYLGAYAKRIIVSHSNSQEQLLSNYINDTLTKVNQAAINLSSSPWISPALMAENKDNIAKMNSVLDRHSTDFKISVAYVLDTKGVVIASSNRNEPDSFVGKDYCFRPYFQDAMKAKLGTYFALGAVSKEKGYYAAYPVYGKDGIILGVVAVKKNLDEIARYFAALPIAFFVNRDGVILVSSDAQKYDFHTVYPISKDTESKISASRQFSEKLLPPLFNRSINEGEIIQFNGRDFYFGREAVTPDGWEIMILSDASLIFQYRLFGFVIVMILCILIMIFSFLLWQKQILLVETQRSEQLSSQLAAIVSSSEDAIIGKTLDGIITSWNSGAQKMYGYPSDEAMGKSIAIIIPPEVSNDMPQILNKIRGGESVVHYETMRMKKDGSRIYVALTVSPIKDVSGKIIGASTIARDITRQKLDERIIKEAAEEWQRTFDSISDAVFIQDVNFAIIKANESFFKLLKLKPEEIVGKKCFEVIHRLDKPWPKCPLDRTLVDKSVHTEEVDDPAVGVPLLVTTSPIFNEKHELIGSVHTAKDISQIKKAREELQKKNEELKKLDQLKSDFISTVSHELRTPLSITKEGINLILDKITGPLNNDQQKVLVTARDNIDRLSRIINELLDISKIESGKVDLQRESVGFGGLIKQAVALFMPKAKAKGLELRVDLPQKDIEVYVDADKIIQVLTNLLDNAIKFTQKGSIEVSLRRQEQGVECIVKDTGIGISGEQLLKIFERFRQFNRVPGGGDKGTGLGLAIAKGIVQMHKGNIWAESEINKGTKFFVLLPRENYRSLARDYIESGIGYALKNNLKFSLIVISVIDFIGLKEKMSYDKLRLILKDVENIVRGSLRRAGDTVLKDKGEFAVFLNDCSKENVLRVEGRISQAIEEYCTGNDLSGKLRFKFGCATYPDDGKLYNEIISRAKTDKFLL